MALLYAVQSGYPIKDLSRSYKSKIEKLLEGGSSIKFDSKSVEGIFKQVIYSYFVRRGSNQLFLQIKDRGKYKTFFYFSSYNIAQNQSFAQKGVGAKYIGIPFNALQPLYLQPTLLQLAIKYHLTNVITLYI